MKKNMKKLLVIVMALMPGLSINSFAQEVPDELDPLGYSPIDLRLQQERPRSGGGGNHEGEPISIKSGNPRPRSVAIIPECYHYEGVVYIEADSSITYINASVTRYADNQVWSNAAGTNTLSITASPDSGQYLLELILSNGESYIGE